jgi:CDGSH-type Zn-finger protein
VNERSRVRVERGGPYVVSGDVPLRRTAQIETEYGEPIGWEPLEPVDVRAVTADGSYRLCRCGQSGERPFCDTTCERIEWDWAEVASRSPRSERVRTFVGGQIAMTDDRSLCVNAGHCGDRFTTVWEMIADTADPAIRARVQHMVSLCPSGRLAWAPAEGADDVEPDYRPEVALVRDGPVWVRGGVSVESEDGTPYEIRNRVTLCRCGGSRNKPFCDGTHGRIGFREG